MPDTKCRVILPSAEYLHQCFDYDPDTGALRWKRRPRWHFENVQNWKWWNARFAGTVAGGVGKRGYSGMRINWQNYQAHRVIWKMMTGGEPPLTIDHEDCDKANNRWRNLRAATPVQQTWNAKLRKNNSCGYKGVSRDHSKWRAKININGIEHRRGRFDTPEEAAAAYEEMAREAHGEFYRVMNPVWAATQ